MSQAFPPISAAEMIAIPLSRISVAANPRRYFSREKHDELVASLRLRGMLQPILLRPGSEPGTYAVVAGERRYRAALEAFGPDGEVPAVVRDLSDQEALEASIDENDIREDASETEQADAAVRVLAACLDDRAEAARRLGWSTTKLERRLALAGLSTSVKTALDERRIKVGHAELLAAVPADKQEKALETILSAGLDVSTTRNLLAQVTLNLAAATFDKTECASCGYNSARQCALFETHVDDGHCTNSACFALKVEAAEKIASEAKAAAAPVSEAACDENDPEATVPGETHAGNPENPPAPVSGQGGTASATEKRPAPATPAKAKVTAEGLITKLTAYRQRVWRSSVAAAMSESADHVRLADLAAMYVKAEAPMTFAVVDGLHIEFEVDLRNHWRVDGHFLAQLSKDELKFVAIECGVVEHMGEKAFAKLLAAPASDLITSLLHVTGFRWEGRIPSAMAMDGKYGPPPAPVAPEATPAPALETPED